MQRTRIGWLLALIVMAATIGQAQGQSGRGQTPPGPPEIAGKWSGTWSSFNPAKATTQPKELCKQLDAGVVRDGETWVATFEGDCGRPYKYKISMNGRHSEGVVLFTGTVDLGAQVAASTTGWAARPTTSSSASIPARTRPDSSI